MNHARICTETATARRTVGFALAAILCVGTLTACAAEPQPAPAASADVRVDLLMDELATLKDRISQLEDSTFEGDELIIDDPLLDEVDLEEDELAPPTHVLARRWFENFQMSGFAAFDFLATGNDGKNPEGGFLVKETTIWIEPQVWDDISVFFELQVNRLAKDETIAARTGEVHVHFRNVWDSGCGDTLGIKVGRIDIPFGEEYLWQDSIDNPLITQSAAYPYGFDEGILFYGSTAGGLGWLLAITDGTDERSIEDDWDKALNVKFYGEPSEDLYLSASFMRNGRAAKSAFEFGGSHFQPVGASHPSSLGISPSALVDALLYEVDAKLSCDNGAYIAMSFGQAFQDDSVNTFDRNFLWYSVEALHPLSEKTYGVARFSDIGTYDSGEGYHFDGKITAGGNSAFGYDARRFQRLSVGLGWTPNPRTVIKAEVGSDWYDVIEASTFTPRDDDRWLAGFEVVVAF